MNKQHLAIIGDKGAGKSTLIRQLLGGCPLSVAGFVTYRKKTEEGWAYYLAPASGQVDGERNEATTSVSGWVGDETADATTVCCGRRDEGGLVGFPEVFDTVGVALLEGGDTAPDLLVMDELGILEESAEAFCRAVLEKLDGDIPVLMVVKNRPDHPFLKAVLAHPKVAVVTIAETSRTRASDEAKKWLAGVLGKA